MFEASQLEPDRVSSLTPEIIIQARKAQAIWASYSFKERALFIEKIETYLANHVDGIAMEVSRATSKTPVDALSAEVIPCIMACQWYRKNAEYYLKPKKLKTSSILFANKRSEIHRLPMGVVAVISPWNYPLTIPFGEVMMGLMAGNSVLLKVASNVTSIGQLIKKVIASANLPKGLFQVLEGPGDEVSEFLFREKIDKFFFTGSVAVGKELMRKASETLTPISLELGGNDPMIVLCDADLERASNGACWGAFQNAGQTCGGVERVYVHESIYKSFLDLLVRKTLSLRHGTDHKNLLDIGGMTTKKQFETVLNHVDEAKKQGATVVAQSIQVGESRGFSYPATVITKVSHEMKIMREETFGPVVCVMPFKTTEEAISLANDSHLALTSSVWSRDHKKAYEIAQKIQAGVTCINDHLYTHALSETPWGGWKESGIGRTHGAQGLEEMTHVKLINWDLLSTKRNLFWYPVEEKTYHQLRLIIQFLHPKNPLQFLKTSCKILFFAMKKMFTPWRV